MNGAMVGSSASKKGFCDLAAARGVEQTKRCVVAQAVIDGEVSRDAPGIFGVDAEPLDILRKAAVASGSDAASCAGRDERRRRGRAGSEIGRELCGVRGVIRGIENERSQCFRICGERAAHHRLVNEINSEARRMFPRCVRHVIAHLIFFLISQNGERRDRGDELIVAESFQTRSGRCRGTERKRQRETEIGIARLGQVQTAAAENERGEPIGAEGKLIANRETPVVVVRRGAGGGKRPLLNKRVVRDIAVRGKAQKPLRASYDCCQSKRMVPR